MRVNGARLNQHLAELSQFGRNPQGGVSRVAYSEADARGREYVMSLMRAAKLDVSVDAAGNLIGRREAANNDDRLPPILFGSHIDSVPEGGNYDGDVGSLGAIEVAQTLAENNVMLRHPIEVIIFQNEEGGLIGSEAVIGSLTERELDLVNKSGKTVREGIRFLGGDVTKLATVKRAKGSIAAHLELHTARRHAEAEKIDIGVVEGTSASTGGRRSRLVITLTTAMNNRQDALLAAAKFIEAVNAGHQCSRSSGRQVGRIRPPGRRM